METLLVILGLLTVALSLPVAAVAWLQLQDRRRARAGREVVIVFNRGYLRLVDVNVNSSPSERRDALRTVFRLLAARGPGPTDAYMGELAAAIAGLLDGVSSLEDVANRAVPLIDTLVNCCGAFEELYYLELRKAVDDDPDMETLRRLVQDKMEAHLEALLPDEP